MKTKTNQNYITLWYNDSPIYTILFPFVNFRQAMKTAQNIVNKSGSKWSFTVTKPKYNIY